MLLSEAKQILKKNGYILKEGLYTNFEKGEIGGEEYKKLPNDFTKSEAMLYFASALSNKVSIDNVDTFFMNFLPYERKKQFNKTYAQFLNYQEGRPIKLYRAVVIDGDEELNLDDSGVCWSFSRNVAMEWAERIIDKHISKGRNTENMKKYLMTAETGIDNCLLPYSLWLAGRFDNPEYEVRLKTPAVDNLKYREID